MRRSTLAFAAVLAFAAIEVAACNAISGVGDFTFTSASSTAGAGASAGSTPGTGGTAGAPTISGGGGAGGAGLTVACPSKACPVTPDAGACCFDNPTEHAKAKGRCVDAPPADDGCITDDSDGGKETRIECSSPGDCPGGSCCATYGGMDPDAGGAWYSIVTCKKSCAAADVTVCDPHTGCADKNSQCNPSMILPDGYFVCL